MPKKGLKVGGSSCGSLRGAGEMEIHASGGIEGKKKKGREGLFMFDRMWVGPLFRS